MLIQKLSRKRKGFTLVELLVVIAIIGVLAAIIIPNAFQSIEKSKVAATISDFRAVKSAALSYYADVDEWPADGAARTGFVVAPTPAVEGWNGPYVERWPSNNEWKGTFAFKVEDGTYFGTTSAEERYVELTLVPKNAYNRLVDQLGSDVVVQDDTTATTVRILVSRDE